jgi:indolepyruvate decarboxylase
MFPCQRSIFDNITCASIVLSDANDAGFEIDRAMEALIHNKRPIYIELPQDIADKPIAYDVYKQGTPESPKSDPDNMAEALAEVAQWIASAKKPVILAGVEMARFDLGVRMAKFAERTNIPIATTLLSKSVIPEKHPLYLGVYSGNLSQKGVQEAVEESDCLIKFGSIAADVSVKNVVACTVEELCVKNHSYKNVQFSDFVRAICALETPKKSTVFQSMLSDKKAVFQQEKKKITTERLFQKINSILDDTMLVVADVGNALYGAEDLSVHGKNSFLGSALYSSMGTAIPGAFGASLARPDLRPIVLVGDGSFQMSVGELGNIVSRRMNPIVFVLNNHGYSTQRLGVDGPFNDIPDWKYHRVVDMVGGGTGFQATTEEELESAVSIALQSDALTVINVVLEADDNSPNIRRMRVLHKA